MSVTGVFEEKVTKSDKCMAEWRKSIARSSIYNVSSAVNGFEVVVALLCSVHICRLSE